MERRKVSTPTRVRSPVRCDVTDNSLVSGSGLPLNILVMKLCFMSFSPQDRDAPVREPAAVFPGAAPFV